MIPEKRTSRPNTFNRLRSDDLAHAVDIFENNRFYSFTPEQLQQVPHLLLISLVL